MRLLTLVVLMIFSICCPYAMARTSKLKPEVAIKSPIGDSNIAFAYSIAYDNDVLVVSSFSRDFYNYKAITPVFIYRYDTKTRKWDDEDLKPSDSEPGDSFGYSIDIDKNRVVVGSPCKSLFKGAAYLFTWNEKRNKWVESKLTPPTGAKDFFGSAVAVDGDTIAVGARDRGVGGAIIIYEWANNQWNASEIVPKNKLKGAKFGSCVSLSGDTLIVGAPASSLAASNSGAVYVFKRDAETKKWNESYVLTAFNGKPDDGFGSSIAFAEDTIAVGAINSNHKYGSAYIYTWNQNTSNWNEKQIKPFVGKRINRNLRQFGASVAINKNFIAIGAYSVNKTYLYHRTPQSSQKEISIYAFKAYSFGRAVVLSENELISGAPARGTVDGAFYVCNINRPSKTLYKLSINRIAKEYPPVQKRLASLNIKEGRYASFKTNVKGSKPTRYQWQKSTTPMKEKEFSQESDCVWKNIKGATKSKYVIKSVSAKEHDGFHFRCIATNKFGRCISNGARLLVTKK